MLCREHIISFGFEWEIYTGTVPFRYGMLAYLTIRYATWASLLSTLVNIMACRVYRRTRTGVIRESEISTAAMAQQPPKMHPIMFGGEATGSLDGDLQHASSSGSDPSLKIERNSIV